MKIAVIGAGAMGSLFGGLLTEAGREVWLLDVWEDHVKTLNEDGLTIEREGVTRVVRPEATTDPSAIGKADLVIVFVKSTQTKAASETVARMMRPDGRVLTLQNGMGNADILAEAVDPASVLAGTTSHGATLLGPGKIRHAGVGPTRIGPWAGGDRAAAESVAGVLSGAGIDTEVAENVHALVWYKLFINVGINAITALTGIKNGEILDLDVTRELSRNAVEEAMAVARARGVPVAEDVVEHVFQVAGATAANRSSMGQDVDNRRLTEISAINGAVVREARACGVDTPVNETLTALVETLQGHYGEKG
ncbi:MAG: 2-dehydropantoate 2-reductase [Deltaproteobacteria bacterium]|nr:MAG: 2-dehydropantoate 2-reductase [Deltaproteobacteria bacterium]